MNGTAPPINRPMKTLGSATLMNTWSNTVSPPVRTRSLNSSAELPIVSMKLANRATAAITAEPIAKPLVTALVVLPTASRLTITAWAAPSNSPDISAIPAALSATGPNVSSLTTTPVVASMPMPVSATRYRANWMLPPPRPIAAPIATAIATTAHTDDSRPIEVPVSTVVAGPPPVAAAMSCTGFVSVDVKYSVMRLAAWASTRPITTAPNMRQPTLLIEPSGLPTYTSASTSVATTVSTPGGEEAAVDGRHRRLVLVGRPHGEHADDRCEHAEGAGTEREQRAGRPQARLVGEDRPERRHTEDDRGNERDLVALEQVGGHAGAVADVVADVVGDRRRVARVVLRDAGFDLADEVGADVGRLGEDATADAEEQGEQRPAEPEPDEDRRRRVLEDAS